MIKILHFADLHLGMENYGRIDHNTGLNSRLSDFLKSLDFIIEQALEQKIDLVVFAGDAYKTREPSPTYQKAFAKRIKILSKAQIPTLLLAGNHDLPNHFGKADTLSIYPTLAIKNIFVSSTIELLNINTKHGSMQVITLPWIKRGNLFTNQDYRQKNIAEINELATEKIIHIIEEKIAQCNNHDPIMIVAHATVAGSSFGAERNVMLGHDIVLPISLFANKKIKYVALGHLHKYQVLHDDPPIVYSGSIERIDFGEEKEDKGFVIAEISQENKTKFVFSPTPTRQFITIECVLQENDLNPTETIMQIIRQYDIKNKVVRLHLEIPADIQSLIQLNPIKKALASANYLAGIIKKTVKTDRKRNLDFEVTTECSPLQALDKYMQAKNITLKRQGVLKEYAQKLLDSD